MNDTNRSKQVNMKNKQTRKKKTHKNIRKIHTQSSKNPYALV